MTLLPLYHVAVIVELRAESRDDASAAVCHELAHLAAGGEIARAYVTDVTPVALAAEREES